MEIQNENYQVYLNTPGGEIPREELSGILIELMANAMFFMNTSLDETNTKTTREGIIQILKNEFAYMPLNLISEAFMKGALGKLGGTTRFTVRNVHIWLEAMGEQYQRQKFQERGREDDRRRKEDEKYWRINHAGDSIFGTAFRLKISWYCAGILNPAHWDDYSLDKIVTLLKAGEKPETLKPSMIR